MKSFHRTKNKSKIPAAIEAYKQGMSIRQIYYTFNITSNFFKKLLAKHNIEYINRAKNPNDASFLTIKKHFKDIVKEYNQTQNIASVAKKYGVSSTAIRAWLIKNNISRRTHKILTKEEQLILKNEAYKLHQQGMDRNAIARKLNTTRYNITKLLTVFFGKSSLRTRGEATRLKNSSTDFQKLALERNFRNKIYTLPSGNIIKVMGYEDDFLNYVFEHKLLNENDFELNNRLHINYKDSHGNYRKYFPDFYIPKHNLVIEIKSTYTLNKMKELNELKFESAKKNYNFICIVDRDYKEFNSLLQKLLE